MVCFLGRRSNIPSAPMPNPRRSSWSKKGICCGPVGLAQESRIPSAPVLLPPSVQRVAPSKQDTSQAVSKRKPEAEHTVSQAIAIRRHVDSHLGTGKGIGKQGENVIK